MWDQIPQIKISRYEYNFADGLFWVRQCMFCCMQTCAYPRPSYRKKKHFFLLCLLLLFCMFVYVPSTHPFYTSLYMQQACVGLAVVPTMTTAAIHVGSKMHKWMWCMCCSMCFCLKNAQVTYDDDDNDDIIVMMI